MCVPVYVCVLASANFPPSTQGASFFVDYNSGSDNNPGTLARPFRTIARALVASRAVTSTGAAASVNMRAGTHYLASTLSLNASDSLLTIQNYNGEQAVVSAGARLQLAWQPAGKPNVYVADVAGQVNGAITGLRRNRNRGKCGWRGGGVWRHCLFSPVHVYECVCVLVTSISGALS